MVRIAFPIDGTVLAPALERIFKYTGNVDKSGTLHSDVLCVLCS